MPVLPSYRNQSIDLLCMTGFYIRKTLAFNGLIDARSYVGTSVRGDHKLMAMLLFISPITFFKRDEKNYNKTINYCKIHNKDIQTNYQKDIRQCLQLHTHQDNNSLQQKWNRVIEKLFLQPNLFSVTMNQIQTTVVTITRYIQYNYIQQAKANATTNHQQ